MLKFLNVYKSEPFLKKFLFSFTKISKIISPGSYPGYSSPSPLNITLHPLYVPGFIIN